MISEKNSVNDEAETIKIGSSDPQVKTSSTPVIPPFLTAFDACCNALERGAL
jgi:hypothetical protein